MAIWPFLIIAIGCFAGGLQIYTVRRGQAIQEFDRARPLSAMPDLETLCQSDQAALRTAWRLLEDEKVYREPDMDLGELATRVGVEPTVLKKLLAQASGLSSFPRLLDFYRTGQVAAVLAETDFLDTTIETIAKAAGYSSAKPLRKAFLLRFDKLPEQYREDKSREKETDHPLGFQLTNSDR